MTDKRRYSNNELRLMFENSNEKWEHVKQNLEEIKNQVIKTNGRVGNLETWRSYMTGAIAVIALMLAPIILLIIQNYISQAM